MRAATAAPANPSFAPYIINPSAGYAYQDFSQNVPLSAWDVSDPLNPKRLAVGFLENNTASGLVDGKYWPGSDQSYDNAAASGPREWLFIFDQPYSTTVHSNYTQDIFSGTAQRVMYMATWNRIHQATFSPVGPPEDRFLINPSLATSVRSVTDLPMTSSLDNNYPNPFNPTTTIPFTLPSSVFVTLRVFDVLGREVSTLVSEQLSAGNHAREFNSVGMSSGIYFYRLQAGSFTQTKKMTLIK